MIRSGKLHLRALSLLAPFLCAENHRDLLGQASGKSTKEVERIAASFRGGEERPDRVRRLGTGDSDRTESDMDQVRGLVLPLTGNGASGSAQAVEASSTKINEREPTRVERITVGPSEKIHADARIRRRVEIRFTADEELLAQIERAQARKPRLKQSGPRALSTHAPTPRHEAGIVKGNERGREILFVDPDSIRQEDCGQFVQRTRDTLLLCQRTRRVTTAWAHCLKNTAYSAQA